MSLPSTRWQLAALVVVALGVMACEPLMLPYFLFVGPDPKNDPEFKLVGEDKHEPVKVLVLSSAPLETRPELLGADRELAALFSHQLQQAYKDNRDNIVLASSTKVQKFKDDHPNWRSLRLEELGDRLDADFVIDLELNHLSLYEPGSLNTLFLGRTDISVTVVNVHHTDEGPVFRKEFACDYPHSGSRPVGDVALQKFRRDFLTHVATELSWTFAAHSTDQEHSCE